MDEKKPIVDPADVDLPPTDEEIAAAARLRDALAFPAARDDDADFARAIALAHAPRPIDDAEHRAIVARAVTAVTASKPRKFGVIRVAFGAATATLAIAAAVALFLANGRSAGPSPALVAARSTAPLFDAPFAAHGGATSRIDRIAMARSDDLRANLFSAWGVR